MTENLIPYVGGTDPTALEDLLLVLAKNVEEALVASGAEPGKDYQRLDLFKLALPFAVETWKQSGKVTFATDHF